jgi:hypothetical protein
MIAVVIIFSIIGVLYIGKRKFNERKNKLKETETKLNQLFVNRARILHNRKIIKNSV